MYMLTKGELSHAKNPEKLKTKKKKGANLTGGEKLLRWSRKD